MNKKQFCKSTKENAEMICTTIESKNRAYSGDNEDPFYNFKRREPLISVPTTLFSRMGDKDARIEGIMSGCEEGDETLKETLSDLIGYGLIWLAYIKSEEQKTEVENGE